MPVEEVLAWDTELGLLVGLDASAAFGKEEPEAPRMMVFVVDPVQVVDLEGEQGESRFVVDYGKEVVGMG